MSVFLDECRTGWRNLLAATIGMAFGVACYTPVTSLFLRALGVEFGWSKTVAVGALVAMPITAISLPIAGRLIDRFGVRVTTMFSIAASTISLLILSQLNGSITQYYGAVIALNVLGCATGPIGYTVLVAAQFRGSRGTALACAQFGIAFVAVLLPPILGAIMARYGWREAYLLLCGTTLLGGIAAQLLMQPPVRTPGKQSPSSADGFTVRAALGSTTFWVLGLSIGAIAIGANGFVTQFQSVLIEHGSSATSANWLLSLLALSVMLSRLGVGGLLDLANPSTAAAAVIAVAAIGAILLAATTGQAMTVAAIILIGISLGAELNILSFFCARYFGLRHYSAIYGLLAMFFYFGIAIGGLSFGIIRDKTGGYELALYLAAGLLVVAALLLLGMDRIAARRGQSQDAPPLPA